MAAIRNLQVGSPPKREGRGARLNLDLDGIPNKEKGNTVVDTSGRG